MLSNAAAVRRGLAPPKLRPFSAAALPLSPRCFSVSFLPVCRARRAENERKNRSPTSLAAAPLGSTDDRGLDLLAQQEKNKAPTTPLLLGEGLPTQDAAYDDLARIAVDLLEEAEKKKKKRVVVGLAGGPGSGKSTAAAAVVERVNKLWRERRRRGSENENDENGDDENEDDDDDVAVVLPMDGFHLTRAQLAASTDPSPEEMLARRGAHWTFDGAAFVETVREVVEASSNGEKTSDRTVLAPSFDHGVGDPCPGAVEVRPAHRLVLVEGNYLLLPLEPWSRLVGDGNDGGDGGGGGDNSGGGEGEGEGETSPLFYQTWFLDVDLDEAMERVRRRQVAAGVLSEEVSRQRIEGNDRPNGELVASTKGRADVVVRGDLPLS